MEILGALWRYPELCGGIRGIVEVPGALWEDSGLRGSTRSFVGGPGLRGGPEAWWWELGFHEVPGSSWRGASAL